ncbi:aldehyde dehydrogenase family protein [Candidatus Woesearchaeota archaeon CG11_big_fil_rev_8_21_14_0_20_43_8]|nr:MAG: aldehyde dehydrogenase family protein [Candidatus Woesearchaeota archaeon CG11_big_fil_rev_8_21_14_0_20_43_8]
MMDDILKQLGLDKETLSGASNGASFDTDGKIIESRSPTDGALLGKVRCAGEKDFAKVMDTAQGIFEKWRMYPAPKRGEVIRLIGLELRKHKAALGKLVSLEMGKILAEGEGEVQEMIDMADFAVGLSRQLYGLTMQSERPKHRMYEQWHPLGVVGVISAFNFPVAVWGWNAFIAAICGDVVVWKPSSTTPLTAIAIHNIVDKVCSDNSWSGIFNLVIGSGSTVGKWLVEDERGKLISATGSCGMGHKIAEAAAKRLCPTILELGGNNAIIAMEDADMELLVRGILFGAVGTAGQRCTSTRRILCHKTIMPMLIDRLKSAYSQVRIGDPVVEGTLMGPLVTPDAVDQMMAALVKIKDQGGQIVYGGNKLTDGDFSKGNFVEPTIVLVDRPITMMQDEVFAPILYIVPISSVDDAIAIHNNVPQGLSSAIFTQNMRYAERFLSAMGSDCGIANVNIGTSGAEIGGAFGGQKETGGGREAGSDAWKAYMRRQTCTINFGDEFPLAQGIRFG